MYGWNGRILYIDLSCQRINIETPEKDIYIKYIGGKGLAGHFLYPHIKNDWDNEDMPLLLLIIYWQAKEINRIVLECNPEGNRTNLKLTGAHKPHHLGQCYS